MLTVLAVIIRCNVSETSKTDVFLEEQDVQVYCGAHSWLI